MIIWGSGGDIIDLGKIMEKECPICEKKRSFHHFLTYRYFHFYWIFSFLTKTEHMIACDICRRGTSVNESELSKYGVDSGKSKIPFMKRWGLLAGFVGIPLLVALLASI